MNKPAKSSLQNRKVLITAGPTHEAIDPVRFIGNHSSGKMGFALAEAFSNAGSEVILVSGPTQQEVDIKGVRLIKVRSAEEMYQACLGHIREVEIAVFAAAVADFTPENPEARKIKKGEGDLILKLKPTRDIAKELGLNKRKDQVFIGFALETDEGLESAKGKIVRKNLDLIVLNSLTDPGAGFGTDTNKVTMIDKSGNIDKFELKHKQEVARDIIEKTKKLLHDA